MDIFKNHLIVLRQGYRTVDFPVKVKQARWIYHHSGDADVVYSGNLESKHKNQVKSAMVHQIYSKISLHGGLVYALYVRA